MREDTTPHGTSRTALPGCTSILRGPHDLHVHSPSPGSCLLDHLGGLPSVPGPHLCACLPCIVLGRPSLYAGILVRCSSAMQEPCLDVHLCTDPVTQVSHCPFRAPWTLPLECPTTHEGPHLGPSTVHRPCPHHTCSARATSASSSGISSSSASGPTWEPRQTPQEMEDSPRGSGRPDPLCACGGLGDVHPQHIYCRGTSVHLGYLHL